MRGYKTSKDYRRLKELLDKGYKVVCFITYNLHKRKSKNSGRVYMEKDLRLSEQRALKAYPISPSCLSEKDGDGDRNYPRRLAFIEGYEQAWKDIKEWVEEQVIILDKQTLLHPDDDVFWGQRNAYKQIKDKLNSL